MDQILYCNSQKKIITNNGKRGGSQKYKGQRRDVCEEEADFEEGHELADRNDQEEHIEEELELIVQHLEDECQDVVLLVVEPVRDEVPRMGRSVHEELPFLQKASKRSNLQTRANQCWSTYLFRDGPVEVALAAVPATEVGIIFVIGVFFLQP